MKTTRLLITIAIALATIPNAMAAPPPMPIISTNCPAYASSGANPNQANDTSAETVWRSSAEPVSTSLPAWLAYDLSAKHPGNVVLTWRNGTPGYNTGQSGGDAYNNVGTYEIDCNSAPGGTLPTTGWVTVVPTISGNTYHSRTHFFNMTGYNWVRLYATASDGTTENEDISVNMDVFDASQGTADTWLFLGDSITDGAMNEVDTIWSTLVTQLNSNYTPDWEDGGIGGWSAITADPYIGDWMSVFPGHYVTINFGTNDAWNTTSPADFTNNMMILVNAVLTAGKVPIIPHIPYSSSQANIQTYGPLLNTAIDQMIAANPSIIAGPDLWTFFLDNQNYLSSDGVHPSSPTGYQAYRQEWANWAAATIYGSQSGPPSAPSNLNATAGNAQIVLSWAGSGGAASYDVFRGTASGAESGTAIVTGIPSTSYTNTGLTNGVTYYYKVNAVNSSGTSGYSNETSAAPSQPNPPAAPTGLTASAGSAQVALNWTASTGATSYNVYQGTAAGGESATPVATGIPTTTDNATGLTNGTTYYFTVKAVNAAGTSGVSNEASAKPQAAAPPAPSGLSSSGLNDSVYLWWTPDSGATSYNLYRGTASGAESTTAVSTGITVADYTDTGVTNGSTYYYEIKAVNASGMSGSSNETSSVPIPAPAAPTGLTASAGSGQVSLSWSASSTATSYNVLRSTISGSGYASAATGISTTSYTNTGLTNGTTYYFVVTAVNAAGTSGNSNQASATPSSGGTANFIASIQSLSGLIRNNLTGWVGMEFQTAGSPVTVTALGRWVLSGNTAAHTVKLVTASNGVDITGGSVSIATSGQTAGAFTYVSLNSPITLNANTLYYIVSQETSGGDQWYDYSSQVTTSSVGSDIQGEWSISPPTYNLSGAAGNDYVPLDFQYETGGGSAPAAPTGLTATPGNAQVALAWTASSGATSYNVYRGTTSGGESATAVATGITAVAYTNTGLTNGTTYYFTVKALNAIGTSGASNEAMAKPQLNAPPAPTGLSATPGNVQVVLAWTASSGATSYNVYRGTASGGESATAVATGITTVAYTNTGLTNGTTYYFTVKALNSGGTSGASNEASAKPQLTAPPAPTGLSATPADAQVALAWTASSGATSYNLYRGTSAGGESATAIATGITAVTYTNTGLTNGTTYYFTVKALNAGGASGASNEASATPSAGSTANFIASIQSLSGLIRNNLTGWVGMEFQTGSSAVTVTALGRWVLSGNSAAHTVKLVTGSNGVDITGGSVSITTSGQTAGAFAYVNLNTPITLNANTLYYIVSQETSGGDQWYDYSSQVTASSVGSDLGGIWSTSPPTYGVSGGAGNEYCPLDFKYQTSGGSAPPAPSGLTAGPGNALVGLAWTASTGATSYNVLRSTVSGSGYASVATGITATNYSNTGLTNGTTYYFVVTAVNSSGTSGYSNQASATPVAGTTANFIASIQSLSGLIRNNLTGWTGMEFQTGSSPVIVTALGRWVLSGNTQTHTVKLVTGSTGVDITGGSVSINTSGQTTGAFAYVSLNTPITLTANTLYYIVSQETSGGDQWYDYSSQVTTSSVGSDLGGIWSTSPPTYGVSGGAGNVYGPVDFKYQAN